MKADDGTTGYHMIASWMPSRRGKVIDTALGRVLDI